MSLLSIVNIMFFNFIKNKNKKKANFIQAPKKKYIFHFWIKINFFYLTRTSVECDTVSKNLVQSLTCSHDGCVCLWRARAVYSAGFGTSRFGVKSRTGVEPWGWNSQDDGRACSCSLLLGDCPPLRTTKGIQPTLYVYVESVFFSILERGEWYRAEQRE